LNGPPGSGKTMLARALPSILPPMAPQEAMDVTKIYSISGALPADCPLISQRPFRASHYTISNAGLVGGGRTLLREKLLSVTGECCSWTNCRNSTIRPWSPCANPWRTRWLLSAGLAAPSPTRPALCWWLPRTPARADSDYTRKPVLNQNFRLLPLRCYLRIHRDALHQ
jgi:hypothetical protein